MHAGRSGACAHISVSSKRGQGDSPCTPPCLQGVVCYTQTDTERKSKENSLPVDDCFHEDFRGCWGDMRAPVFGALITTQQSFVGRSHAAYCGRSFIRSVLLFLLRCIEPNTAARCQPYRHSGLINILTSCLNTKKESLAKEKRGFIYFTTNKKRRFIYGICNYENQQMQDGSSRQTGKTS